MLISARLLRAPMSNALRAARDGLLCYLENFHAAHHSPGALSNTSQRGPNTGLRITLDELGAVVHDKTTKAASARPRPCEGDEPASPSSAAKAALSRRAGSVFSRRRALGPTVWRLADLQPASWLLCLALCLVELASDKNAFHINVFSQVLSRLLSGRSQVRALPESPVDPLIIAPLDTQAAWLVLARGRRAGPGGNANAARRL